MSFRRQRIFRDVDAYGRDIGVIHSVQTNIAEIKQINEVTRLANGSGTASLWKNRHYVKIASVPLALIDQWW